MLLREILTEQKFVDLVLQSLKNNQTGKQK